MSHRDSPIKTNKELSKPMDIMNVGFVGVAGGGAELNITGGTTSSAGGYNYNLFTSSGSITVEGGGDIEMVIVGGGGGAG